MAKHICKTCSKEFFAPPFDNRKYCSHPCYIKFRSGKTHWRYKDRIKSNGYYHIHNPEHPNCNKHGVVSEHRSIMEKKIGRYLLPTEVVHHINGVKTDNRIGNLVILTNSSHSKLHRDYQLIRNPIGLKVNWATLSCKVCKKSFKVIKSRGKKAKYCSRKCSAVHLRESFKGNKYSWKGGDVTINCAICNTPFPINKARLASAKYCSRKCFYVSQKSSHKLSSPVGL